MTIQINLLPWREQSRQAKKKRFLTLMAGFFLLSIFLIVLSHIYLDKILYNQIGLNDMLRAEINNEQNILNSVNTKVTELGDIKDKLHFIIGVYAQSYNAIRLLNELTGIVPSTVSIDKIIRSNNIVTISGMAQSNSDVTNFLQNIGKSPIFNQPQLNSISGEKDQSSAKRYFELSVVEKPYQKIPDKKP